MNNELEGQSMTDHIEKEGRLLKQLYFWCFLGFGLISPFAGIFYKKILVNSDGTPDVIRIGIILTFAPLMGLLTNLLTGILSDRSQKGRHIITWLCIASFFTALVVGFGGSSFISALSISERFLFVFIAVLAYRFTMMPLNALLDSEAMQFLNQYRHRKYYGSYRFWGTIGWAVATPTMGAILWITGNYSLIFYVGAFAYLAFAFLGSKSSGRATVTKVKISWRLILKDWHFVIFLIFAFLVGIIENSTATYMGYFFDDVMDTPLKIGLVFSFWTTLEIPVMKYSKQLITFFGNRGLVVFGLLLSFVKLLLFSMFTLETPFYFQMLAALIHGPAFAFLFLGTVDMVDRMAHKNLRATYMSTTAIARYTLAGAVGAIWGAQLIDRFGGALFMRIASVAMLVLIPFFILFVKCDEIKK